MSTKDNNLAEKFDVLSEMVGFESIDSNIIDNLNPKFELREYQLEALQRLKFYFEKYQEKQSPSQLLFQMATGSGKTLVMAGSIIYLYMQGYRNFIFFVNSTNIIKKTEENFLNIASSKYLFDAKINLNGKPVDIKEVDNFNTVSDLNINIHFTTVQGLHIRLNEPRENSVTYEDFENKKVVLLSDEAHHINTLTKKSLNKGEQEEKNSWEGTVNKIFTSNKENVMLEFTATAELDHPAVREKYKDKIIFDYSLRQFKEDGYSKEVKSLASDTTPIQRALQAIIVSQFRRKVAQDNRIQLKPVVMIKSNYVNPPSTPDPKKIVSEEFREELLGKISKLTGADIEELRKTATAKKDGDILEKAFEYFAEKQITDAMLIEELKADFNSKTAISIDSTTDHEDNQLLINTLEEPDNEIRIVFAVDSLNEGWDVLNLYDIVRVYETRDSGKKTVQEAQLIGRGARYYPFKYADSERKYQRKFDNDLDNDLRVLEELHFHSFNEPRYISEIKKALKDIGIYDEEYKEVRIKIKDNFKETGFWDQGLLWVNKKVKNTRDDIFSLSDMQIDSEYSYEFPTGYIRESDLFADTESYGQGEVIKREISFSDININIVRKALDKFEFFNFRNLKQYFPKLKSRREFIQSKDYLGGASVSVSGTKDIIEQLIPDDLLKVVLDVIEQIKNKVPGQTSEFVGTKEFEPLAIKVILEKEGERKLKFAIRNVSSEKEAGIGMKETLDKDLYLDLSKMDWYVYEENFGTRQEKLLVHMINNMIDELNTRYDDVYLLRNEKLFKLYRFSDGKATEPDFVLFLNDNSKKKKVTYQLFIEPKGEHLIAKDKWKEDFLLEIEEVFTPKAVYENKNFRVVGLPFFNETLTKNDFKNKFAEVIDLNIK